MNKGGDVPRLAKAGKREGDPTGTPDRKGEIPAPHGGTRESRRTAITGFALTPAPESQNNVTPSTEQPTQ